MDFAALLPVVFPIRVFLNLCYFILLSFDFIIVSASVMAIRMLKYFIP